jgi:hypothetical protein
MHTGTVWQELCARTCAPKGATAAWAAEMLRSSEDTCALTDGVQDRLVETRHGPSTWSQLRLCQPATFRVLPPCRTAFGNTARTDDHPGPGRLGPASATGGTAVSGAAVRDLTESERKIEDEFRSLYAAAYTLLTASGRTDQATRAKTAPGFKRSRAFHGDVETDSTLNPFAE